MPFKPKNINSPVGKTRAGQRAISKIKSSTFLPGVFQSGLNSRWLDATLDLMISKGDLENIDAFVGSKTGKNINGIEELYVNNSNYRDLQPAIVSRENQKVAEHINWDQIQDLVDIEFNNYDYNSAYTARAYTFSPPINLDKFVNYNRYQWCPDLPAVTLHLSQGNNVDPRQEFNGKVTGKIQHDGGELQLWNGMKLKFSGDGWLPDLIGREFFVSGVGESIQLLAKWFFHTLTPFTKTITDPVTNQKSEQVWQDKIYTVCSLRDRNPTSFHRANRWIHIQAVRDMAAADPDFPRLEFTDSSRTAKRHIIEFNNGIKLFNVGTNFKHIVDYIVNSNNPDLPDGSTYVVKNDNSTIYTVGGDSSPLNEGDFFTVKVDMVNGEKKFHNHEWRVTGTEIVRQQTMETANTPPLFDLVDAQGKSLADYPESTFAGSQIFGYKRNKTGITDNELNFKPVFKDVGNRSDFVFENFIDTETYFSQEYQNNVETKIKKPYRYTGEQTYNSYVPADMPFGATSNMQIIAREKADIKIELPMSTWIPDAYYEFHLQNDVAVLTKVINDKIYHDYRQEKVVLLQGSHFRIYDKTPNGVMNNPAASYPELTVVTHGDHLHIVLPDYEYQFEINGIKFVSANLSSYYRNLIDIKVNGQKIEYSQVDFDVDHIIISEQALDNSETFVVDVEYHSNYADANVIPDVVKTNSVNKRVSEITFSETVEHWMGLLESQPNFQGQTFGINNYDYSATVKNAGGKIFISDQTALLHDYAYANDDINVTEALQSQAKEWENFRNRAITITKRLFKADTTIDTHALTDMVLDQITETNRSKITHRFSNMVYSNTKACREKLVHTTQGQVHEIPFTLNSDDFVNDHMYVYLVDNFYNNNYPQVRLLRRGVEYNVVGNTIETYMPHVEFTNGKNTELWFYKHKAFDECYVPASFAKLGLSNLMLPEVLDNGKAILCHDGFIYETNREGTEAINKQHGLYDPVAAVLFEIEKRIYNNIQTNTQANFTHWYPTVVEANWYTRHTVDDYIERFFLQWKKDQKQEMNPLGFYDPNDPFTWNYKSIFVGGEYDDRIPGYWRGAYITIFGTDQPHKRPWEMLGFGYEKPTWWFEHYSWTDPVKRGALIEALTYGVTSKPGDPVTQDLRYARNWDWANACPVDDNGELVTPDQVLLTPSEQEARAEFVFGDWSPLEYKWRNSPRGHAAMLDAVVKLNPTLAWDELFQVGLNNVDLFHSEQVEKFVTDVEVTFWNEVPIGEGVEILFIGGNGSESYETARGKLHVTSTGLPKVELTEFGRGYTSQPNIVMVYPENYQHQTDANGNIVYPIVEYKVTLQDQFEWFRGLDHLLYVHKNRNRAAYNLVDRYRSLETQITQPLAGFTNKNIIDVKSESSYTGEYVLGENDFDIIMSAAKPEHIITASSVSIIKTDSGYIVSGYSNHRQEFLYFKPTGDFKLTELPDGTTVKTYSAYETTPSALKFGTKLLRIQDVYDFLKGYYLYLDTMGVKLLQQKSSDAPANEFVAWAVRANVGETLNIELGQFIAFESENYSVLPIGELPGKSNALIVRNSNGEIANTNMSDMCITRVGTTMNVHPNSVDPINTESGESIITVISSTTALPDNIKQGQTGGVVITDENGVTSFRPALLDQDTTVIDTTGSTNTNTQLELIQGNDVVKTPQPDVILSISFALTRYTHQLLLDNVTSFNETIYRPELNARQERLKLTGQRTRNWQGRKDAPGYLIQDHTILQNFDTVASDMIDYYDLNTTNFNDDITQLERMTVGVYMTDWIKKTGLSDNVINKFMQGVIKYKGSNSVIPKFNRSQIIKKGTAQVDLEEYWMFNMSTFNDTSLHRSTELVATQELITKDQGLIDLTDPSIDFVNLEKQTQFQRVSFDEFGVTQRKAGDLQVGDYRYVAKTVDDIPGLFDETADYATIPTWFGQRSYKRGDLVRKDGFLYQCNVDYIGYRDLSEFISAVGTNNVSDVDFGFGNVAQIEGVTIAFDKTVVTYNDIEAVAGNSNTLTGLHRLGFDEHVVTLFRDEEVIIATGFPTAFTTGPHDESANVTGLELTFDGNPINLQSIGFDNPIINTSNETFTENYVNNTPVNKTETFNASAAQTDFTINEVLSATGYSINSVTVDGTATSDFTVTGQTLTISTPVLAGGEVISVILSHAPVIVPVNQFTLNEPVNSTGIQSITVAGVNIGNAYNQTGTTLTLNTPANDGDEIVVTYGTSIARTSVTKQALISAINNDLIGYTASEENDRIKVVKTLGGLNPNSVMTIGGTGASVMKFIANNYTSDTAFQTQDAPMDAAFIVQTVNNYILQQGISTIYSASESNGRVKIIKKASSGLGPTSTLEMNMVIQNSAAVALDFNPVYNITVNNPTAPGIQTPQVVVQLINDGLAAANVPGVTASYTNNTISVTKSADYGYNLDMGDTAFNGLAGLPTGLVAISSSGPNVFDPTQWTTVSNTDPALFGIWALNDSGLTTNAYDLITAKYNNWNLLVSQRLNSHATIDAGDESTDGNDAKVSLFSGSDLGDASKLRIGDIVMLVNTTTTPNIQGLHRITSIDANTQNTFFIDRFIEESGRAEQVFVFRNARFTDLNDMNKALTSSFYNFELGQKLFVTELDGVSGNYVYEKTSAQGSEIVRSVSHYIDNTQLANVVLYDAKTQSTIQTMEVYDPLQGIIPGVADREIDFKYPVDVAVYNTSNDEDYDVNQRNAWGEEQVGQIWWDTSSVFYVDYKLGDKYYAKRNWGLQTSVSSIDVYEWTKSSVTPDKWSEQVDGEIDQFGVPASGEAYRIFDAGANIYLDYYVEDTIWNSDFNRYDSVYYFWVKNKTTITSQNKTLSTSNIASIIDNPTVNGIAWCAAIGDNEIIVNNIASYVNNEETILQVNIKPAKSMHSNWTQVAEGTDVISDYHYIGLRDNLVGTQSLTNVPLPDKTLHEYNRYGDDRNVVFGDTNTKHSQAWFKDTTDARREVVEVMNELLIHQNLRDDLNGKWDRILSKTFYNIPEDAIYGNELPAIDSQTNEYHGRSFVDSDGTLWRGSGSQWFRDEGWDMTLVWDYADYITPEYEINPVRPTLTVPYRTNLADVDTSVHTYVEVGRKSYDCDGELTFNETYNWDGKNWNMVKKQNATIQFNDLIWKRNSLFAWDMQSWEGIWDRDPSTFVKWIITAAREDLFIEKYLYNFNSMFFSMIRYIAGLHVQVDWFYKTTFIKLNIETDVPTINESNQLPRRYYRDGIDVFEGYVNQVKPFHTKIRTVFDRNLVDDKVYAQVTDSHKFDITIQLPKTPEKLEQVWDHNVDVYTATFEAADYVANGGTFDSEPSDTLLGGTFALESNYSQTDQEHRRHAFNGVIDETLTITVQRNTTGSTTDADTRTWVYVHGNNNRVAAFSLTEDAASTITNIQDTTIEVADGSLFSSTGGIAYINNEVVSYVGVTGNKLEGVIRGVGNTVVADHQAGTQIVDITDKSVLNAYETTSDIISHTELPWTSGRQFANALEHNSDIIQSHGKGLSV